MQRLRNAMTQDRPALVAWCMLGGTRVVEAIAGTGVDAVLLDMQHGMFDETGVLDAIGVVAAKGAAPLVRIPLGRWDMASRAMDFGALGVVAPMINSGGDAEAFAAAMKYVPLGARSYGPRHAAATYGVAVPEYLNGIDAASLALAMIETREAVAALDDILAVPGIDGVLIGPGDLSISLTGERVPDAYGPASMESVERIVAGTLAAGKIVAAYAPDAASGRMMAAKGVHLLAVGDDTALIEAGMGAVRATLLED